MRAAGVAIARAIERQAHGKRIAAVAGSGNNGGDAFAAFAELDASYDRVVYARAVERRSEARLDAESRARAAGVRVEPLPEPMHAQRLSQADLIVDGILGVGTRLPLGETESALVRSINASRVPVLAIDVPSGIDPTTGAVGDPAVRPAVTVTLGALKSGLLLEPARDRTGELWFAPIGFDQGLVANEAGRLSRAR